ncbi:MAG: cell division protein FtsX, partial [Polyangiales bacterium]
GASDSFVKTPYILEGTFQGAIGSAAAVAVLALLFFFVRSRLDADLSSLLGLDPTFLPIPVAAGMIATGALLGAMGGALGLRRLTAV